MRFSCQKVLNECMISDHVFIHKFRMTNEISHGKMLLKNFPLKEFTLYLMKLSSMRYQTLSTFTDFKRNEEKTDNEVNYKDILSLFDNLNHV